MNHLFIDLEPKVFVYLDDLVIATESFQEHLEILQEVARRLKNAGLTINAEKSVFCRKSLRYLGYVLNEEGWHVDEDKVEAISKFPAPTNKKEVQRFIGMCGWYRRFIKDFSQTAVPLTELTKAKTKFKWTEDCERAFQSLKSHLISAPVLATPNYSKPFAVACDASDVAIGGVLTQDYSGGEKAISYFSQKLSSAERKYSVTQRECLAVIRSIEKFRGYLEGTSDPRFDNLLEEIQTDSDRFPDFRIIGDQLYKNCIMKDETGGKCHRWKKVIPTHLRQELIHRYHDIPTAAHLGCERTLHRIQRDHYWPQMATDIRKYVQACDVCKANKADAHARKCQTGSVTVGTDIDRLANAQKMSDFLEHYVFHRFSTPRIIVSDSGSQFLSQAFQSLLKRYNVIHMRTAFYTPMCNAAERTNRTLITCVRSLLDDDQRNWDVHIQQVVCAINTAKHESLGCSSHYCDFGRDHILFINRYPLAKLNSAEDPVEAQKLRIAAAQNIQHFVLSRIKAAHDSSKQRYDLRARHRGFTVGEIVWRHVTIFLNEANHTNVKSTT
ncbi:uncharacterized protein LOC131686989 [Topomyia yanbarensis]|uniref:uncharacterized protein LOC131686989 n=1 Tax=Topomyia yanbarensis TaxID=2498891 RepID=UPI00273C2FCE|nr:uncharacterized protein LOC131686989 [Topomyia yanbarensis]